VLLLLRLNIEQSDSAATNVLFEIKINDPRSYCISSSRPLSILGRPIIKRLSRHVTL
jgi:hypothetical protein